MNKLYYFLMLNQIYISVISPSWSRCTNFLSMLLWLSCSAFQVHFHDWDWLVNLPYSLSLMWFVIKALHIASCPFKLKLNFFSGSPWTQPKLRLGLKPTFFFSPPMATSVAYGISWARGQSEAAASAFATATAKWDLSHICNLNHNFWQCQILNPLIEAGIKPHPHRDNVRSFTCWATQQDAFLTSILY